MSDTGMELVIVVVVGVLIFGALGGGAVWFKSEQCQARWADSRESEWGLLSGCLVEDNGQMVPEDRIWFERNPG